MFLVFLERYEWEIETRYAMLEAECKVADAAKREEEERRFEFIVGNYSVRRFLEDVEREFEPAMREQTPVNSGQPNKGLGRRLGRSMRRGWAKSKRMLQAKKKEEQSANQSQNSTPPLFGEIGRLDSDTATVQKHDRSWMTGLLWYYGLQNPPPPPQPQSASTEPRTQKLNKSASNSETVSQPETTQSPSTEPQLSEKAESENVDKKKARDCMAGVKRGIDHVGGKLKQVFTRCKYVGGFQTLDG
ncbi:hypothetical protein IFR04_007751 [Cadophora malorum]|uniref:Uncharacterized protein n=1 Tax=Cadophora malorum TaxID=108018 RepID=A0A8H7W6Q4_9HELO|nr:hypothetical protein IFR04_007751 [Cadophora malorum]